MDSLLCIWLHVCILHKIDLYKNTLTAIFIEENHIEVVKFLLANGANQSLATEVIYLMYYF